MALELAEFLRNYVPLGIEAELDSVTEDLLLAELAPSGASVLEILRGESICAAMGAKGCRVDALDLSRFEAAQGPSLPPAPSAGYDVIVLADVLGYAREPLRLLLQCGDLLNPGGCVLAVTPNFGYGALRAALATGVYEEFARAQEADPRIHFFTQELLGALLARAGYSVEETLRRVVPWQAARNRNDDGTEDALLERVRRDPDHATFSFVVKAVPAAGQLEGIADQRQRSELTQSLQRELESVMADLDGAFRQRDDALVQLHRLDAALSRVRREREAMKRRGQRLHEDLESAQERLEELRAQMGRQRQAADESAAALKGSVSDLQSANAELARRAERAERTALELASELLESTKAEISQLSILIDTVQRSRFWRVKYFLRGLRGLLVR